MLTQFYFHGMRINPKRFSKMNGINRLGLTLFGILLLSFSLSGQILHRKMNAYNSEGKKDGLWITPFPNDSSQISSREHYKDGYEKGVCKHYHSNGVIRIKWRYYKNRIRAKYFSEARQLELKGWSKIDWTTPQIHYYWHGKWKYFDENRKLINVAWYENGDEVLTNSSEQEKN